MCIQRHKDFDASQVDQNWCEKYFSQKRLGHPEKISNKNNGVVCHPRNTELHYLGEQISILFSKRVQ